MTYLDLQRIFDEHTAWNRRYYMKDLFLQEVDAAAVERMVDGVAKCPSSGG
jgi:ferredoxin